MMDVLIFGYGVFRALHPIDMVKREKCSASHAAVSATTGILEDRSVKSNKDRLKVATVVQQIMTELSEAVSEKDKIMFTMKMVHNLLKQNGC
jgi:hypothetical protein